jgi:hypothetical protein
MQVDVAAYILLLDTEQNNLKRKNRMANIKIHDIRPTGADLFNSSESYLQDLSDVELLETNGGSSPFCITLAVGFTIGLVLSAIGISVADAQR